MKNNISDNSSGLADHQLAVLLKVHPYTVTRWRMQLSYPNGNHYPAYAQWEVRGTRWFPKSQQSIPKIPKSIRIADTWLDQ